MKIQLSGISVMLLGIAEGIISDGADLHYVFDKILEGVGGQMF